MKLSRKNTLFAAAALALVLTLEAAPALAAGGAVTLNASPVAENMELDTYRGVSVSGTLKCLDPEGDEVTYSLVTAPKKGSVELEGDTFTYTPADGKKGKDTFTYAATDSAGNVSNIATVTVNIKKQKTSVTYSDMAGSPEEYAAVVLAESGAFVGEQVGGQYLFRPDAEVTRGEFLVMCMKVTGAPLLEGITRTGFYDDGLIPMWQKPYVTTALMEDIITGSALSDGRIVFSPGEPITFAEASVMLNNTVGITDVYAEDEEPAAPAWAAQAVTNLSSCGILPEEAPVASPAALTRSDAARMIAAALRVLAERGDDSLLRWAK